MKFLIDRCAGRRLAIWLREQGHDVWDASGAGPDPGDAALLEQAARESRILVTIDADFGTLIHVAGMEHAGMVRLPDVPAKRRIEIFAHLLMGHSDDLQERAIITVRGARIRVSKQKP